MRMLIIYVKLVNLNAKNVIISKHALLVMTLGIYMR
jgi:hypothetical protein